MIDAYTAPTANCRRVTVMLEAAEIPYRRILVDRAAKDHRSEAYLAIHPAAMVPAIVDHDGPGGKPATVVQSAAILIYLAEKSGKFLPAQGVERVRVFEGLMQAMTDVNWASSAFFHLNSQVASNDAAKAYITERLQRYLGHSNGMLARSEFLGGKALSIADFALLPVANRRREAIQGWGYEHVLRWLDQLLAMPALKRGLDAA